jgi:hypothetical protein
MNIIAILLAFLAAFSLSSWAEDTKPAEAPANEAPAELAPGEADLECQTDDDCIVTEKSCCPEAGFIAINLKSALKLKSQLRASCSKQQSKGLKASREAQKAARVESDKATAEARENLKAAQKALSKAKGDARADAKKAADAAYKALLEATKKAAPAKVAKSNPCSGKRTAFSRYKQQARCVEKKCSL